MLFSFGSETAALTSEDLREALSGVLATLGERRNVLAIPPDFSRYHSGAGEISPITNYECRIKKRSRGFNS